MQKYMVRIQSIDLKGANAYFTNFDNRIVSSATNLDTLKKSVERTLKVLLLTKNNVVCAASHLTNDLAYNLLSENKILLEKQLLIPAFRADKKDISELFVEKNIEEDKKKKYIDFYNKNLTKTVLWELIPNSNWFRETFINGLSTKGSVIRQNLKSLSDEQLAYLISEISNKEILDRGFIDYLCRDFDPELKIILKNYRELIYHMSGARVVNCESTLPQENYIDYSLADLKNREIQLSELQVFWKIFIELLFETLNKPKLSIELLDTLSFEDIYYIRQPIQESSFIENYNNFYKIAASSISKTNEQDILYNLNDLMKIRNNLENSYKEIFGKELLAYYKKKALSSGKELLKNTINIGLGFLPMNNFIAGSLGILNEFKSLQFNILQLFKNLKSLNNYDDYIQTKEKQIRSSIEKFEIDDKTELVDVIELITNTISNNIQL